MSEDEFDDLEISESELREADALAHALERGGAREDLPEDALQTAALLRYTADGGELAADREDAVLSEVLEAAQRVAAKQARQPDAPAAVGWWRWIFAITGTAAVAVALVLVLGREPELQPTPLPSPSAALLSSGLGRLGPGVDERPFEAEMRAYRESVYGALSARYE